MGFFRRKDHGAKGRGAHEAVDAPPPPEPEPSAAIKRYHQAAAVADARVAFYKNLVVWGMVVLFLLFTAGFEPAITVGMMWGIFLAVKGYNALWVPELRHRWIQEEMQRLDEKTRLEKAQLQGRHNKNLEQLSASIAHEIRNPITAAKSLVQQMGEDPSSEENVEYAKIALDELDRVEKSISHLLRYAREEGIQTESLEVDEVIESALETFRDRLTKTGTEVEKDLDPAASMSGDPEKLRRVMINLIANAIDSLEESHVSDPKVSISSGQNLAGDQVWIRVKDNGPGIEADRVEKIWSPFHTSKATGTGLGLAITKKLVEGHQGSIEVESEIGMGTEFILTFPTNFESRPSLPAEDEGE